MSRSEERARHCNAIKNAIPALGWFTFLDYVKWLAKTDGQEDIVEYLDQACFDLSRQIEYLGGKPEEV